MQANCLRFIKFIAAKMDSETCRNLGIADNFMVIAQIVGKFWNMNQPMSHYLKIVGKFQNMNQPMSNYVKIVGKF